MESKKTEILSLTVGESDFDTPDYIKEAAIEAIHQGVTKYTDISGVLDLRKAIQEKFQRDNHIFYDVDQIIVSSGVTQIIFNALFSSINPGDEVMIASPYWRMYPRIINMIGGKPVSINCAPEDQFRLSAKALREAITPQTKWLILNSPNNPTGAVYSFEDLRQIADVLLDYPEIYIFSDDIYEYLIFDEVVFHTLAEVEPKLHHRILTANGLSKSHNMTGWRIGYAGGPKALIQKMAQMQYQITYCPCSISQTAAIAALRGEKSFLKAQAKAFQDKRDVLINGLSKEYFSFYKPEGALYLLVNCSKMFHQKTTQHKMLLSSKNVVEFLKEKTHVLVSSGCEFGLEGFIRMSYAAALGDLKMAVEKINQACQEHLVK